MQKFFIKIFLFTLIIGGVVFYFSASFKRKFDLKTDYLATLIDKEARLNSLDSNRLILIGGSNLAFGINSELIEKELPVKVANLGLHAGLGLPFMINQVSNLMKKGDVVVLSIAYPLFLDSAEPDIDLIQFIQELDPQTKNYYHFSPKEMLIGHFEKFRKYFTPDVYRVDPVFNRTLFNKYGDNEGHLNKEPLANLKDRKPISNIDTEKAVQLLSSFAEDSKNAGVQVLISYPPYPKTEFVGKNKERIIALDIRLRNRLPSITFLDSPETHVFDDSLFYDTIYHLHGKGRDMRTKMLIEDLKHSVYNNR